MKIEFDPAKDVENIRKHRISLAMAAEFDFNAALITQDLRHDYGEERLHAVGFMGRRLHFLVYTWRGNIMRIISLRKANARETEKYHEIKKRH